MQELHEQRSRCGCKGVRSCLACESSGAVRTSTSQREWKYVQCRQCGRLLRGDDRSCSESCSPTRVMEVRDHVMCGDQKLDFGRISVVKNFISEEEEERIISAIDSLPWAESQSGRRKQDYGPRVNFKKQRVKLGNFTGLPSFSKFLVDRLKQSFLRPVQVSDFSPVELCVLDYSPDRGAAIDPHQDDHWLWGERLLTVSLLSEVFLTFTHPECSVEVNVPLLRRSLVVVQGAARHHWFHSILRENVTERRVAITLRELSSLFLSGGPEQTLGFQLLEVAQSFDGKTTNFT